MFGEQGSLTSLREEGLSAVEHRQVHGLGLGQVQPRHPERDEPLHILLRKRWDGRPGKAHGLGLGVRVQAIALLAANRNPRPKTRDPETRSSMEGLGGTGVPH